MKIFDKTPYLIENCEWPEPTLDLYLTDSDNDTLMLIFPGGGYCCLAEHEGRGYAEYFNSIGLSAAVLNYRCKPYKHPCQLLDARRAVRLCKANCKEYGINPEKIVLVGSSAGGHLAAMTASYHSIARVDEAEGVDEIDNISPTVAGILLCYPVISMTQHQLQWCVDDLLGDESKFYDMLSVEKSAGFTMPPAFIWTTLDDNCVDSRNSLMLASRYKELGLDCELHIFPHGPHGIGLALYDKTINQWNALFTRWLISHGLMNE